MTDYETIVGMEIHVELKTKSKMFCGCKNDPFYAEKPNTHTCPVCLGLPGGIPVPNRQAVNSAIMLGLALGCEIPLFSKFDRKNYFYPDLAKGYQISQYDQPFCINGKVTTDFGDVRIHRVHLEEDTGKLQHTTVDGKKVTLVDFNRSGVPLVEIVTEADIRSGDQAKAFLKKLQQIIRYLGVSDADMEKGSMRLEPNISVRKIQNPKSKIQNPDDQELPKYKVEVKNINSFNFVKKAIEYETARHIKMLEKGETPLQETRGYNADKGVTYPQRLKENADDYRYFPEPDIPPLRWSREFIDSLKSGLPELPDVKRLRFSESFGLNDYDSGILTESVNPAEYFEEAVRSAEKIKSGITPKTIANWMINRKINTGEMLPAELISRIGAATADATISDSELEKVIKNVADNNPKAVLDYKNGKEQVIMFLVGQVMKQTAGKAKADEIKEQLKKLIQK
jgi:aspartyl-tRNA(Asn)/glutamyl-tRNA(Gln) amidotransferase subunit B